ncbi:hypothetical protein Y032_0036g3283 [Ancylostoma ceylanicum]|uniref:Uncharacterized protein n=1 Tax=Ancylostoma ceylanicum TaxID=53326 RepID=A0A016UJW6_9BILA|nr:hypothetical protein Y032_0036g3283 [Ancylostoma ceylanicum]
MAAGAPFAPGDRHPCIFNTNETLYNIGAHFVNFEGNRKRLESIQRGKVGGIQAEGPLGHHSSASMLGNPWPNTSAWAAQYRRG